MAETIIVCTRKFVDSIGGSAYIALQLKGMGRDVALVYDRDALIAFAEGKFESAPLRASYVTCLDLSSPSTGKKKQEEVYDGAACA